MTEVNDKIYRYETHMHTAPVSKCGRASARESLEFYKRIGYDGVFITNHFLDGNINISPEVPYQDRIEFYFSDYEEALSLSEEIGIKVFCGVELSYGGTDFLIYGLDKQWYLEHPQIMEMKKSEELPFLMEQGALVIQAHPFREAAYIDHIRLYPRCIHGVEVINASRNDFENGMAEQFAANYGLLKFAGTDNHVAEHKPRLAGMCSDTPLKDEQDFVTRVKNGKMQVFELANPQFCE